MKNLIVFYLLMVSARGGVFKTFDIALANALVWEGSALKPAPSYIRMIADMKVEAALPEAWRDFVYELKADLFGGA